MSLKLLSLAIFISSTLVNCKRIRYMDCGSQVGKINYVDVTPCDSEPCHLHKNNNYTVNVGFTSAEATDQLFVKVYGKLAGVPIPFPFKQKDACQLSGISCPINNGQELVYTATLPISRFYPDVKVIVEWYLRDRDNGKGNILFCFAGKFAVVD